MQVEAGDTTKRSICASSAFNAKALTAGLGDTLAQGIHLKFPLLPIM